MTTDEFSYEFDVHFNNIMSNQAPGLNGYDKSVYLTKAQEALVLAYFSDKDIALKKDFDYSKLIVTEDFKTTDNTNVTGDNNPDIVGRGYQFVLDKNPIAIIDERVIGYKTRLAGENPSDDIKKKYSRQLSVRPISNTEYSRLTARIDKNPPKYESWRIHNHYHKNNTEEHEYLNIILPNYYALLTYQIQYVRMPKPIIVENIEELYGTTIDGVGVITECELPVQTHRMILEMAVQLAKKDWRD